MFQKAHEDAANKPQDELEAQVLNEKNTYERRANARRRLESTGKLVGLEMKVTNEFAVYPYRSRNPADELWEKPEEMRSIGPSMQGSGVEAHEYAKVLASGLSMSRATSIFEASSPKCKGGNEPRIIASIARSLKKSAESSNAGGRVEQMAAARSYRRTVEIESLMNERKEAMLTNGSNSVWAAGLKEPPPAAIGNAIPWMPRSSLGRPPANETRLKVNRAMTVPREDQHTCQTSRSGRTRRQQICACCSQPRVRGHVLVCTHVNKVCAKCRATAGK